MNGGYFYPESQKILENLRPISNIGRLLPFDLIPFSKEFVRSRKERIAKVFTMTLTDQCKYYREIAFFK